MSSIVRAHVKNYCMSLVNERVQLLASDSPTTSKGAMPVAPFGATGEPFAPRASR
jgi:hypothetical protein